MRTLVLIGFSLTFGLCANARAADPAADFYGNSLLCKAQSTGAVCDLWLDADGHYAVFYDSGKRAIVKDLNGDFENEGRTGTYTASRTDRGLKICLKPDPDSPARPRGHSPTLFRDKGCTTLASHATGEIWTLSLGGEQYRVALIKGR